MYPTQTSLIPVTVALTRLIENRGWTAFFSWYPNWYLGVPFRYLGGPVVPSVLAGSHKVIPEVSLFTITIYFILFSFVLSSFGWMLLARKMGGLNTARSWALSVLLMVFPFRYFVSLTLAEGSFTITRNLLPFVLLSYWVLWGGRGVKGKRENWGKEAMAIFSTSFLLLVNTSILPIFLVGLVSLIAAKSYRKGKFKRVTEYSKIALKQVVISILAVSLWYGAEYWLVILANPSIGGVSGFRVIVRVFDLLKAAVPLLLAISAVYFSQKIRRKLSVFSLTWLFTFFFLTLFRFIGDPDFWQDWTSWLYEIEVGAAFVVIDMLSQQKKQILISNRTTPKSKVEKPFNFRVFTFLLLLLPFYLTWRFHLALGRPRIISAKIPQGVSSLEKLAEVAGEDRVFISGSTVFWANALYDFEQVRGGVDKAAVHPYWDHAAFQLREGRDPLLAKSWLQALGVKYVLVHGRLSKEAYHDFRFIEKWDKVGEKLWEGNGDAIYKIEASSIAWEVEEAIKNAVPPQGGGDLEALKTYLLFRKQPLGVLVGDQFVKLKIGKQQMIEVVVSFNSGWQAYGRGGRQLPIKKSPLGHILVETDGSNEVILKR